MHMIRNDRVVLFLAYAFLTNATPASLDPRSSNSNSLFGSTAPSTSLISARTSIYSSSIGSAFSIQSSSSAPLSQTAASTGSSLSGMPSSSVSTIYTFVQSSNTAGSASVISSSYLPASSPKFMKAFVEHPDPYSSASSAAFASSSTLVNPVTTGSGASTLISSQTGNSVDSNLASFGSIVTGSVSSTPILTQSGGIGTSGSGTSSAYTTSTPASLVDSTFPASSSGSQIFPTLSIPSADLSGASFVGSNGFMKLQQVPVSHANGFIPASYVSGSFIPGHFVSGYTGAATGAPASITAMPTPIAYNNGDPVYAANATLPRDYATGVLSIGNWGNCSMVPGVDGYNFASCSCVNKVAQWFHDYATATITSETCQSTYDMGVVTQAQQLGCSDNTITQLASAYTAPPDCCNKCTIRADAVQLIYWPSSGGGAASGTPMTASMTASGPANATMTAPLQKRQAAPESGLVSGGFTFISPSVYVVYTSISASASCVALTASFNQIGDIYTVTRAYAPEALSTARCVAPDSEGMGIAFGVTGGGTSNYFQGIFNGWEAIDYAGLDNPPSPEELQSRYQTCFPSFSGSIGADFAAGLYTKPQLSFPPDVTDIDPIWETWGGGTCTPVALGVYDPPRALGKATALAGDPGSEAPVTAVADSGTQSTAAAAPAATASNPAAEPTGLTGLNGHTIISGKGGNVNYEHNPENQLADPVNDKPIVAQSSTIVAPAVDSVVNEVPPANPVAHNAGPNNPSAVIPGSGAQSTAVDPNDESAAQMSALRQALAPISAAASPQQTAQVDPNPVNEQNDGQVTNAEPKDAVNPANVAKPVDANTVPITLTPVQASPNPQPVANPQPTVAVAAVKPAVVDIQPVANEQPATNTQSIPGTTSDNDTPAKFVAPAAAAVVQAVPSNNGQAIPGAAPGAVVAASAVPSVGGQPIVQNPNSDLVIAGSTLANGAQTTADGHVISNGGSHVVVDGSTQALPVVATTAPLLSNNQVVQITNGGLQVAGQTLVPGSQVTASGHIIDYANPSNVIVDGTSHSLAPISTSNPLVVGNQSLQRASSGALIVAGTTIAPGQQAVVSGHVYSVAATTAGSSNVIVDGSTYSLPPTKNAYLVQTIPSSNPAAIATGPITLGNGLVVTPQITPAPGSNSVANQVFNLPNGAAVSVGGSAAVVSGTTYSALPSNQGFLVNGASTLAIPAAVESPSAPRIFTVGGETITAAPTGFPVAGRLLLPGGPPATISGIVLSLDSSSHLQIGSSTINLGENAVSTPPTQSIFSVGGQTFTAAPTGFSIAPGTTLSPGGSAVTISGTPISLAPSGSALVIGSSTMSLPTPTIFTVGGQVFTAAPAGFALGSTTLTPNGAAATISGTAISLGPSGSLVIGTNTLTLPSQSIFTLRNGAIFTAAPTGFAIEGATVKPGGSAVTEDGAVVSLGTNSVLQIGTTMATLGAVAGSSSASASSNVSTSGTGLGGAIVSPFRGAGSTGEALGAKMGRMLGVFGIVAVWAL